MTKLEFSPRFISESLTQALKALSQIIVTLSGIVIDARLSQRKNAFSPIIVTVSGIDIDTMRMIYRIYASYISGMIQRQSSLRFGTECLNL